MDIHEDKCRRKLRRVCILTSRIFGFAAIVVYMWIHYPQSSYSEYLRKCLEGPIRYDNQELIQYIQQEVLEPPSTEPYNLAIHARDAHYETSQKNSEAFYKNLTKLFFGNKRGGIFVEAGALDGQAMSNTLWLEMHRGWTGLLVEPDPSNYNLLKMKNRKAWTVKACLSLFNYPQIEKLSSFDITSNIHEHQDVRYRSMGSIVRDTGKKSLTNDETANSYYLRQCFPLGSLLLAVNVTKIDLFSLDVEFVEEEIIKNFDFERFDVQLFYIEWWMHDRVQWLFKFMQNKGYIFVADSSGNFVFAKKNTEISKYVEENWPNRSPTISFIADVKSVKNSYEYII